MDDLTPMYRQWAAAKREYPDVLLMFRMGDFYEMFGEDAEIGARELELVLTSRAYGKDQRMPMCGAPHHQLERYLSILVQRGYRVAICDQVEDPKKAKGLVRREVTRVISPGTVLEDNLLTGAAPNFLLAIAKSREGYGIAIVDVSTGEFLVTEPVSTLDVAVPTQTQIQTPDSPSPLRAALDEITRIGPAEVIAPADLDALDLVRETVTRVLNVPATAIPVDDFEFRSPAQQLCEFFKVDSLRGFGCEDMPAAQAAAALALRYLQSNRLDALPHLTGLTVYSAAQFMMIDPTTRRNLELTRTLRDGDSRGTLLSLLDKTGTPMGSRLLRTWLLQPLLDVAAIRARLEAVDNLVRDTIISEGLRDDLKQVYDLERLVSRAATGTANARDLRALCLSLGRLPSVIATLQAAEAPLLGELRDRLDSLDDIHELLTTSIAEEPPLTITEGGVIRSDFNEELDGYREAAAHGREWIAHLQDQERGRTGIKSLKVGYNNVFGYYIEISRANQELVPDDYLRKQTLVNAERYITPELKEMEGKILGAQEKAQELEYELFCEIRAQVAAQSERVLATARAIAQIDVLCGLARAAMEYGYCKPEVDNSDAIVISEGRHPVVERTQFAEAFVPNDAKLDCDQNQLLVVTGPNMAGKSTYLRQVALITLMAQMGSFVPAKSALIGIADRIFTRVGASDDLATGQSTFMVEMTETANILHNATDRSLVILDEIGRGTSTFDGLSIAWAVAEYLVQQIRAKTLFATHYHHLNELCEILPRVKNLRIAVKEQGEDIIFLRKIIPGGTDRSYGIQVARLAGLPVAVIERAKEVLHSLEQEDLGRDMSAVAAGTDPSAGGRSALQSATEPVSPRRSSVRHIAPTVQLSLFESTPHPVVEELLKLELDTLTPVEALMILKRLQDSLKQA